jgi:DNA-binding SARP family transcriptional activator
VAESRRPPPSPSRARSGPRRLLDVLGAATAALLAFTAVPAVLVFVVGDPLSGGLGHAWQPVPRAAMCVVALAAWVAWLACCTQLLRAVVAHVRAGEVGGAVSVVDRLAARIALGVLALSSVGGPLALSATAGATVVPHVGAPIGTSPLGFPAPTADGTTRAQDAQPVPVPLYTVQQGDTLWQAAHTGLDDGAAWTALAALNLGRAMGDGQRFVDPAHLLAGWRLRLPVEAAGGVPTTSRAGSVDQARRGRPAQPSALPGDLPEIAALGIGSIACAGLARRARRRLRPQPFTDEFDLPLPLSDRATDAAVLLSRFEGVPALRSFESANCLLASALFGRSPATFPEIRAANVTPRGVTFWLSAPCADAPEGFASVGDGNGWHVAHERLDSGAAGHVPHLPLALPVGDDAEGTWILALRPGQVLPLLGEAAGALERSMRSAVAGWDWAETILVGRDPIDPAFVAEAGAEPSIARHLLYFGPPDSVAPDMLPRTAVVTTAPARASDLSVLVDHHGATIHPLGHLVRPHLQSARAAESIEELLDTRVGARPSATPRPTGAVDLLTSLSRPPSPEPAPTPTPSPAAPSGAALVAPGVVDVRLLAITPRLDGLREELPPNRARRAVELVAYLALHQPDVITSDRLRTRVLGSSDADAASKTLFNVAHAARRAMGLDDHGAPLLPSGTRNGEYQISPDVTVDVRRAADLASEGHAHTETEPALAIAYFRAALDLVEGEPLANALSGYTWWEAEGHGGRISAVLVDAACAMAALAAEAELLDLARWGLERARLVEPYSEALSRAAMELAAAEGDTDRLRHEWQDCQRRIDALDPGSTPSPRTESLYGRLSREMRPSLPGPASHNGIPEPMRPRYAPVPGD